MVTVTDMQAGEQAKQSEELQKFRVVFPSAMASYIKDADTLFTNNQQPDTLMAASLSYAYKMAGRLEPEQVTSIIMHREQVLRCIQADNSISSNQKDALLFKATFIILRDAINGKLPELQGNYTHCDPGLPLLNETYAPPVKAMEK